MSRASVIMLLIASFSAAVGQLLLKLGAQNQTQLMEFVNARILLGLAFYLAGTAIWIFVLSIERLTDVYAFTALTFVLVYVAGVIIVGEKMFPSSLLGVGLVLLGLYLIVAKPGAS